MKLPVKKFSRYLWADALLIFIFIVMLWLPTLDFFGHLDRTETPGENRLPAPPPKLTSLNLTGLKKFIAGSELYFNDHFGFRNRLIRWFRQWKMRAFHDESVRQVIVGRDHWLYTSEQQTVEHFLGLALFTPQQLRDWQRVLERRRDWLAQRGIKYIFVIAPDKSTIYPEHLPAWLANAAATNRETKLDQFFQYMKRNSTVNVLDLRAPLFAAKKSRQLFLQNDTHWNFFGAFIGAQALMENLSAQIPDFPPLKESDFVWSNAPARGGDLARMAGLNVAENNFFISLPDAELPTVQTNEFPLSKSAWGVKSFVVVKNPFPLKSSIVIFHDSFGTIWRPYLGYEFKRAVFVLDNHEFNPDLIVKNSPVVVVNQILERLFNTMNPEELLAKDNLPTEKIAGQNKLK
jgi:alginate O-acetyltransferase complex protein AlgJ